MLLIRIWVFLLAFGLQRLSLSTALVVLIACLALKSYYLCACFDAPIAIAVALSGLIWEMMAVISGESRISALTRVTVLCDAKFMALLLKP